MNIKSIKLKILYLVITILLFHNIAFSNDIKCDFFINNKAIELWEFPSDKKIMNKEYFEYKFYIKRKVNNYLELEVYDRNQQSRTYIEGISSDPLFLKWEIWSRDHWLKILCQNETAK